MRIHSKLCIRLAIIGALACWCPSVLAQPQPSPLLQQVEIVRLDPRLDKLIPPNTQVERIVSGQKWVEGPVWNRKERYLLFFDIPANAIIKWQQGKGASVFLKPSGYTGKAPFEGAEPGSNGLAFDPEGRLVLAQHGDRRIARLEYNGRLKTLVERFDGRRINSPNDLVFKSNGDLYFTDPPFGLPRAFDDPRKELPFQGVYKYSKSGKLALLTQEIKAPNGIAFSPDEKKLYVSNAEPMNPIWMVFDVKPDGTIENGKKFFAAGVFAKSKPGGPDGMKVDRLGNIFTAGPGGVYVIGPDGAHLGTIDLGAPTGNVAWGKDGSTLFIASNQSIFRLRLATRGAGF
jgi:gluconolactonase